MSLLSNLGFPARFLALLLLLGLVPGCGQGPATEPTSSVVQSVASRVTTEHEGSARVAAEDVSALSVSLRAGWNGLGFQGQELTAVSSNPAIPGFVRWTGTSYATGNFTAGELNAAGGGRTGFYVYANQNTSFTYSARDVEGSFLDLALNGYQLVSFATSADIPGSRLAATRGGQSVPLNTVVAPQFQEVGPDNSLTSVDVTAGGVLKPGRAYWVFANTSQGAVRLSWASPAPSPSPTLAVVSLDLTPVNATVGVSGTLQYTLVARLANGTTQDVTNLATWTSQDPSVAALVGPGLFKGLNPFPTRIRAELSGVAAETELRVIVPTVPVIVPSPSPVPRGHLYLSQNLTQGIVRGYNSSSLLSSGTSNTTVDGANTQLGGNANALGLDVPNNQLYVGIYTGRTICSFAPATTVTGNIAPTTSFSYPNTFPTLLDGMAFDSTRNRLYAGTSNGVLVFDNARNRTGAGQTPTAQITFGSAMLGVALDEPNDRLFVTTLSGTTISVFDNASLLTGTLTQAAAASRTVTGVPPAGGLFIDSARQRLYEVQTGSTNRIHVFTNVGSPAFSGAVAPSSTVTVTGANFGSVCYVSVDTANDQLFTRGASTLFVVNNPSQWSGSLTVPIFKQFPGFTNLFGIVVDSTRD